MPGDELSDLHSNTLGHLRLYDTHRREAQFLVVNRGGALYESQSSERKSVWDVPHLSSDLLIEATLV